MFDTLSDKLQAVLSDVRSRGKLNEDDINKAMREIRLALLEADVNFKVVRSFTAAVKERALGAEVMESLNPGQQVVKIVNEELTALMGDVDSQDRIRAEAADRDPDGRPAGLGQDDRLRQARHACSKSEGKTVALVAVRRLPPGGRRPAPKVGAQARRARLRAGHRPRPASTSREWALDQARRDGRTC